MKLRIIWLVITGSSWYTCLNADTIPERYVGFQAHYGFIIPHSESIEEVSHTNPFGFEINLNMLHQSFDEWKVFNAYWISGIRAAYFNFQNPDVLGDAFLMTLFAEPVLFFREKCLLTVRLGAGISYHSKVYDPEDNPLNMFFSTKINFPLYVDARFKIRTGDRSFFTVSGCYNHISNGGFKQPNKGMNFPTLAAGIEINDEPFPFLKKQYSGDHKPTHGPGLILQFLTSVKVLEESENYPEQPAFIYGFHTRLIWPLGYIYSLNAGAEMIIDNYIKESVEREGGGTDHKRIAVTLGQDFNFGNVIFTQYFGFYVYAPYKAMDPVYQKYELSYRVHKNLIAGVFLKAHRHVAELMGITVNYHLPLTGGSGLSKNN
jgi:hypothetical protein